MAAATVETLQLVVGATSMSFHDWEEAIYAYGVPLVLGALLTVYRREMSCNRVFHDEEEVVVVVADGNNNTSTQKNPSSTTNNNCDDDDSGEEEKDGKEILLSLSSEAAAAAAGAVPGSGSGYEKSFCYISEKMEVEAEELLDGAGLYCSGQPILALFASVWLEYFTTTAPGCVAAAASSCAGDKENKDLFSSDLLDHAGNFSVEPIVAAMALAMVINPKVKPTINVESAESKEKVRPTTSYDPLANELPQDVHVHIASFLHPKDVITLSCVSKSYREIVDYGPGSNAIWKTLWERDYAWIVHKWDVGRKALRRSNPPTSNSSPSFVIDKEFYFTFVHCYVNYVLAGQNTQDSCLVGLHSHIYDITNFLNDHPGSPDTIMVHAGRDCTNFFEDMNHSMIARRISKKLCVVADMSHLENGWGVRPTAHTVVVNDDDDDDDDETDNSSNDGTIQNRCCHHCLLLPQRYDVEGGENLLRGRRRRQRPKSGGTLQQIRDRFNKEQELIQRRVVKGEILCPNALDEVTPFYDPFLKEWKVWYTSHDMETVFLPAT